MFTAARVRIAAARPRLPMRFPAVPFAGGAGAALCAAALSQREKVMPATSTVGPAEQREVAATADAAGEIEAVVAKYAALHKLRSGGAELLVVHGHIDEDMLRRMRPSLRRLTAAAASAPQGHRIDVVIHTAGGDASATLRLLRDLRLLAKSSVVELWVPYEALSGGSMLALGLCGVARLHVSQLAHLSRCNATAGVLDSGILRLADRHLALSAEQQLLRRELEVTDGYIAEAIAETLRQVLFKADAERVLGAFVTGPGSHETWTAGVDVCLALGVPIADHGKEEVAFPSHLYELAEDLDRLDLSFQQHADGDDDS